MYKEGSKLYSISCHEIRFSSDLLPLVDLAEEGPSYFRFLSKLQTIKCFSPRPASSRAPPRSHALHFDYFNNSQLLGGL